MTGASNKEWTDYIGSKPAAEDRKISLQVPDALLESLAISTTNEDITLPALAVTGQISLSTNGGSIAFETLDVGSAFANSHFLRPAGPHFPASQGHIKRPA